jgi:TPR repeat protein
VQWIIEAAEKGISWGIERIGREYYSGYGLERDYVKANKWLRVAAEISDPFVLRRAQCLLGDIYSKGEGVNVDFEEAFTWYSKAAENKERDAQLMLSEMYYYGRGVEIDYCPIV